MTHRNDLSFSGNDFEAAKKNWLEYCEMKVVLTCWLIVWLFYQGLHIYLAIWLGNLAGKLKSIQG